MENVKDRTMTNAWNSINTKLKCMNISSANMRQTFVELLIINPDL